MKESEYLKLLDRLWRFDAYGVTQDRLIIAIDGGWIEEHIKERVKEEKIKGHGSQFGSYDQEDGQ